MPCRSPQRFYAQTCSRAIKQNFRDNISINSRTAQSPSTFPRKSSSISPLSSYNIGTAPTSRRKSGMFRLGISRMEPSDSVIIWSRSPGPKLSFLSIPTGMVIWFLRLIRGAWVIFCSLPGDRLITPHPLGKDFISFTYHSKGRPLPSQGRELPGPGKTPGLRSSCRPVQGVTRPLTTGESPQRQTAQGVVWCMVPLHRELALGTMLGCLSFQRLQDQGPLQVVGGV